MVGPAKNSTPWFGADGDYDLQVLWEDGERIFCRVEKHVDVCQSPVLAVLPAAEHPTNTILDRFAHEFELRDELDQAWAVRPLQLVRERGRIMLLLDDARSE